jgi:alpha-N-acetylglucosaminidase
MNHSRSALSRILDQNNRISIESSRLSKNGRKPIRQKIYEILVGSVTQLCYGTTLNYFPQNAAILDVGIGNGFMMKRYHELVKAKALKITGIDVSAEALMQCARRVKAYGLKDHIELHQASIEDFHPEAAQPFDFIFFSMSFMLLEDQGLVLERVRRMIPAHGEIVFFQTLYAKQMALMNFIKPRLKYISGIEFGPVSYEEYFFALLASHHLPVKEDRLLQDNWFQGQYRLIVAAPEGSTARH